MRKICNKYTGICAGKHAKNIKGNILKFTGYYERSMWGNMWGGIRKNRHSNIWGNMQEMKR